MKGFGETKIIDQRIWVDGKEIKSKKDIPQTGKVIYCKIEGEMLCDERWFVSTASGKAVCGKDDAFDWEHGRDIAFARAKKGLILKCMEQLNKISGNVCDSYYRATNALEYTNYELMAMGAKKQLRGQDITPEPELWEKIQNGAKLFLGANIDRVPQVGLGVDDINLKKNLLAYKLGKLLMGLDKMTPDTVQTLNDYSKCEFDIV